MVLSVSSLTLAVELTATPDSLQNLLHQAVPGSVIKLAPGTYKGPLTIDRTLTLNGQPGVVIDGRQQGVVLLVNAPEVVVQGLELINDRGDVGELDAVIFVGRDARGAELLNNRIHARGFGIWVDSTQDVLVKGNVISGDTTIRSQDRGNGIHLFNVSNANVIGNRAWDVRDGIYIDASNYNRLEGNELHDLRYGIHYMFSHSNEVIGNRTYRTRAGFALMASKYLKIRDNWAEDDENYGLLLNDITFSVIENNRAIGIRHGTTPGTDHFITGAEGKAMFIYNSQHNEIRNNLVANTDIGIHMTAGAERNVLSGNSLVNNRSQVMYVANRQQEWSEDGRGNYWSDYVGWDLSGNGIGDVPHEPNDSVDRLLWTYPMARLLMNSPAVQLLRWVQREFPVLRPSGVRDSAPLMRPVHSLEELQ